MLDQTMTASETLANSQPPFRHEIIVGNKIERLREKGLSSLERAMMKHPDGIGFILGTDSQTIQDCVRHHPFVNVKSVYGSWQSKKVIELANDSRIYIGTIEDQRFFAGEYRYIFADQIDRTLPKVCGSMLSHGWTSEATTIAVSTPPATQRI